MSWSMNVMGTPKAIKQAIAREAKRLTGQSSVEFNEARPHLEALVDLNMAGTSGSPGTIEFVANGHANFKTEADGTLTKTFGSCSVNIKSTHLSLVTEEPDAPSEAPTSA